MEGDKKTFDIEYFKATMMLAAVGDAIGYKNGDWQFNTSSKLIHK